jgi:hypothetical protein
MEYLNGGKGLSGGWWATQGRNSNLESQRLALFQSFSAPLRTVLDPPIHPGQLKSDIVALFLGFIPLMLQNLLVLGLVFLVEQRLFQQIVCRA